ncbi:hypothetical protein BO70DRAFT_433673 [Aspergillus heteromorphus CBS 117.55]|uniref:NAD(P)-binding protein n=1 Tax=Aspergillus heteromorphus CBS 117.55 TaxID=1448321 RepID=A0A317US17_9EURO|nr:uncharacterized protein BO70DRAFT_433673 [Aspergillus heteromorphus CBS 117.55]PWY64046.1 hypothetical protein BO70DRAFT_433673 [Aspergillus heteromorphus CBS 117.55]
MDSMTARAAYVIRIDCAWDGGELESEVGIVQGNRPRDMGSDVLMGLSRCLEQRKSYALVRSAEQADAVKKYGAEPIFLGLNDHSGVAEAIIQAEITIIYYLIDAYSAKHQPALIKALGDVKKKTGKDVHFLHTAGAKEFSSHAGMPTHSPLLDTDPQLYELQKTAKARHDFAESINAVVRVIDTAEALGVRSYILAPCIVYGKDEGFGNQTSIQDVAIVNAAMKLRRTWPVCHIIDTTTLYLQILRKILSGDDIGYGKHGYFLAASGSIHWKDLYSAMAQSLAKRGVIEDEAVTQADEADMKKMGEALKVSPEVVPVLLGGE